MYLLQATVPLMLHMKHRHEVCKFALFSKLSDKLTSVPRPLPEYIETHGSENYSVLIYLSGKFGNLVTCMESCLDFPEIITDCFDEVNCFLKTILERFSRMIN